MADIQRLLRIMARLRDPEGGCPWDLEQDFASISPYTIEEAYEVDEAIASGDPAALRDELGDLLFQVVFQARIAEEKGLFAFDGVVEAIAEKLVRRHPHVFASGDTPESTRAQLANWEDIKAAERAAAGKGEGPPDPFEGIPRHLPALARSAKIEGRAAQSGASSAIEPAAERAVIDRGVTALERGGDEAAHAVGEALRAMVRLARDAGVDLEQALREADDREIARVRAVRSAEEAHQGSNSAVR